MRISYQQKYLNKIDQLWQGNEVLVAETRSKLSLIAMLEKYIRQGGVGSPEDKFIFH